MASGKLSNDLRFEAGILPVSIRLSWTHISPVVPRCEPITALPAMMSSKVRVESPRTATDWLIFRYGFENATCCLRSSVIVMPE